MKKQKYVLSALAALTILTSAVGFSTFADEVPENSNTVIETVIEDEETQQTDEEAEEETSKDGIIDKMIKSAKKKIRSLSKETNFTKRSGKKSKPAGQEIAEGEAAAEEYSFAKPEKSAEKKSGRRSEQEITGENAPAEENTFAKPEKKAGRRTKKNAEQSVEENVTEEVTEETAETSSEEVTEA